MGFLMIARYLINDAVEKGELPKENSVR